MTNVISFNKEKNKRRPEEPFYTRARPIMSPEKAASMIRAGTFPGAVFEIAIVTSRPSPALVAVS